MDASSWGVGINNVFSFCSNRILSIGAEVNLNVTADSFLGIGASDALDVDTHDIVGVGSKYIVAHVMAVPPVLLTLASWMALGPDPVAPTASTRGVPALAGLPDAPTNWGLGMVGIGEAGSRALTVVLGVAFWVEDWVAI